MAGGEHDSGKNSCRHWVSPLMAFLLPFLVVGGWNAFMIAMHGPAMPDAQTSRQQTFDFWLYFLFTGGIAGLIGLVIERFSGRIVKWWKEPTERKPH